MRQRILDLNMLLTLVTIADTGTMTAAAERLSYTQSTVSMQLNRLEAALGVPLHERDGRRIRFTAEGQKLVATPERCWNSTAKPLTTFSNARFPGI
ncbi:LysR family transcriptional regulator [Marinobacter sp. AC-23]|uniref:LysR family transcriptional regulator n=1 Tax=Marinobacter sp. AC-23 TaxID=1879031 RepID=UPI0020C92236|nr:LysR family transcriptional regulator [Marinobacter sp. AC-23]